MNTTKKENGQTFERLTRKELKSLVDDIYSYHPDTDSAHYWIMKDGSFGCYIESETTEKPNVRNIDRFFSDNGVTVQFFGDIEPVRNEHYGDWELSI